MKQPAHRLLAVTVALAWAGLAAAQGQSPLKANEVTEAAIVDALTPAAGEAAAPRSRGFSPGLRPQPAKPSSAAVLITFVTNSSELTSESSGALDVIARALGSGKLSSLSFRVEGHADPRGDSEHNLELSRERAESVVSYLVAKHGIDRQRLVPIGKGAAEPLNKSQLDAPENRRVTFVTVTN